MPPKLIYGAGCGYAGVCWNVGMYHANEFVAGQCFGLVETALSSDRSKQSENVDRFEIRKDAAFGGRMYSNAVVNYAKHPGGRKKQMPFVRIAPMEGIVSGARLMEGMGKMWAGMARVWVIIRDTNSQTGSPFCKSCTAWVNKPITGDRKLVIMRVILEEVCDRARKHSEGAGVNSPRHFMVNGMTARNVPAEEMVQVGLWGDHALKNVEPQKHAEIKRGERQGILQRVYASEAGLTAVRTVKLAETEALRRYVRDIGGIELLPSEGHWDHFGRFTPRHPGAGVREKMVPEPS